MKRLIALCGCLLLLVCLWAAPADAEETEPSLTEPTATATEPSAPASPSTEPTGTTTTETTAPAPAETVLTLSLDGTVVTATLRDAAGAGITGYPLTLTAGRQTYTGVTDSRGMAAFAIGSATGEVVCTAADAVVGGTPYRGSSASVHVTAPTSRPTTESSTTTTELPTTTTESPATTTKPPTTDTTTEPEIPPTEPMPPETTVLSDDTFDVVAGTGTTSLSDGYIAVGPLVDKGILRGFGLTIEEFDSNARLLIPDSQYNALSGVNGAAIWLNVRTSTRTVSPEQIRQAVGSAAGLEGYTAADTQALTVELSLQAVDAEDGDSRTIVNPANAGRVLYTVQLPVPESLRECAAIGVALTDDSGLHYLNPVPVTAGVMEFRISGFGSFTILGFGSVLGAAGEPEEGSLSPWAVVGFVFLGLILAAGVLWLYVACFRQAPQPAFLRRFQPGHKGVDEELLIMAQAAELEGGFADEPSSTPGDAPAPVPEENGDSSSETPDADSEPDRL